LCQFEASIVQGYACDNETFEPLKYRLNGFLLWLLVTAAYATLLPLSVQSILYRDQWVAVAAANAIGLVASFLLFFKGGQEKYARCVTVDQTKDRSNIQLAGPDVGAMARFFLGSKWNPRYFGVDIKMWLYVVGAVGLQFNILSCLFVQREAWGGQISLAMGVYVACFSWFIGEYMLGEAVHIYTYDIFAEKMGFKLAWGCLVFYPFFYNIAGMNLAASQIANKSVDVSPEQAVGIVVLFFVGWVITRGANMQKYAYRTNPAAKTFLFGLVQQKTIPGTRILCSGWWGVARHFNYLGEILQGLALALPGVLVGQNAALTYLPLLYPVYYCALFIPRQIDDNAVCKLKYGKHWDEYVKQVPYRIFPGVW
jgi:Delta14-sterol reductase